MTTGGNIRGRLTKLTKSFFSGNDFLANIKPVKIPNGRLNIEAIDAILRDIKITVISSSVKLIMGYYKSPFFEN